jgi:hypothetical protein
MDFINNLFSGPPFPKEKRQEVEKLIDELIRIGKTDDYLSERPGPPFNSQSRHNRARQIGKHLHDIGGLPLMEYAFKQVRRKLGKDLSAHLEYCWAEVGGWLP